VFWVCVFLANFTLLKLHNNWTGWGEVLMALCCFSYFLIIYMESLFPMFPNVYRFMEESVSSGSAWLGALLSLSLVITVDGICKALFSDFIYPLATGKPLDGGLYYFFCFFGCFKEPRVDEDDDAFNPRLSLNELKESDDGSERDAP